MRIQIAAETHCTVIEILAGRVWVWETEQTGTTEPARAAASVGVSASASGGRQHRHDVAGTNQEPVVQAVITQAPRLRLRRRSCRGRRQLASAWSTVCPLRPWRNTPTFGPRRWHRMSAAPHSPRTHEACWAVECPNPSRDPPAEHLGVRPALRPTPIRGLEHAQHSFTQVGRGAAPCARSPHAPVRAAAHESRAAAVRNAPPTRGGPRELPNGPRGRPRHVRNACSLEATVRSRRDSC